MSEEINLETLIGCLGRLRQGTQFYSLYNTNNILPYKPFNIIVKVIGANTNRGIILVSPNIGKSVNSFHAETAWVTLSQISF